MQPRESKPVLIRSDCLGQLEHADPKAACTGNIADHLFLAASGEYCWALGILGDAGVYIVIVLVIKSDVDMSVGPCTGPIYRCHCSHLANHAEQNCGA